MHLPEVCGQRIDNLKGDSGRLVIQILERGAPQEEQTSSHSGLCLDVARLCAVEKRKLSL